MTKTNSSVTANNLPTNPFVGLRPFESEEAYLFFGRNEQSVELMKKLHRHRFIGVVGSSGCGKSSLIRAGLIPKLKAGCLVGERDHWVIAKMKPGDAPFLRLADGLVHCVSSDAESGVMTSLPSSMPSGPRTWELAQKIRIAEMSAVIEYLKPKLENASANLLLLVDQFEEIINFGLKSKDPAKREEAESFVSLMLELAEQRALPIYVVMTMRSDFLGECDNFHGLPEALNRSQYLVPRLTRKQRQLAVEGPVRLCGRKVTPRLLDCVINEAGDQSDQLPVMQHALMRTWEKWSLTGDKEIDLPHYEAAGKIKWALSNDAEKALDGLSPDELEIAKRMFQALTATDQDNRHTSHPSHFTQLLAVTGATPEQLDKVIERFRGDGRSFLVRDKSDDPLISISHESLIRQWKTLNDLINEELYSVDIFMRLADDAARYEKQPSKGRLWRDPELEEALEWREQRNPNQAWAARYHPKFAAAMNFLDKSREESEKDALEEKRQRQVEEELKQMKGREEKLRRRLIVIPVIFGLFLLSLASTAIAIGKKNEADTERALAKREQQEAIKQKGLAEERRQEAIKQEALAKESEAEATQQGIEAKRQRNLALQQGIEAERQRKLAVESAKEAQEQRERAEGLTIQAKVEAKQLREQNYVAKVGLAQFALEEANNVKAEGLLKSFQPKPDQSDLRSFPWYHLWLREQQAKLNGYAGRIKTMAHSSNRTLELLAAASENKTVIVWNAKTRRLLARLSYHNAIGSSVAFSPDGRLMATAGDDGEIAVWSVSTLLFYGKQTDEDNQLKPRDLMKGHTGSVHALAFQPGKENILASAGADGQVKLWDLKSKKEIALPLRQEKAVLAIAFSPNGEVLATAGADNVVKLWNVSSRQLDKTLEGGHDEPVNSVQFSTDGKLLATASDDDTVKLWDIQTGKESAPPLKGHLAAVRSVAFSPDGKRLATASKDSTVKVWDLGARKELMTLEGHESNVSSVIFLSDSRLATASSDSSVRLWNIDERQYRKTLYGAHKDAVREVAFSPDGKFLASGSNDKTVKIWDADTGQLVNTLEEHTDQVASVYFSPDSEMLASAGEDKKIKIWEKAKNWLNPTTFNVDAEVRSVAFSPKGGMLASADANGTVMLWDINKDTHIKLEDKDRKLGLSCVQFSPIDGNLLATAGSDGWVSIWNAGSGKKRRSFKAHEGIAFSVSFSSDGKFLASAGQDGTVKVWDFQDTKSDKPLATLDGSSGGSVVAMFAPGEDATLAMRGNDGTLKLWDSRTREEIMSLKGGSSDFVFLAFSSDGKKIATADNSGSITIWFAATDDEVKRFAIAGISKASP